MYSENKPILFNCPKEHGTVEIYPVHDLHYGSEQFNLRNSTFSSTTADSPKINLKTPTMSARCSTTYLSTANAAKVDQTKSTGFIKCKLYRCRRAGFLRGATQQVVRMLNEM